MPCPLITGPHGWQWGHRRAAVGMKLQGPNAPWITCKLSTSHNSFARIFGGNISCRLTSHRLITMLIHSKIICPFLRWHMHCHLVEPLIGNVCGSFESWLFSHWIFKLLGNCVGLNGWLLINPFHYSKVWQGERKLEERNGLSTFLYFQRAL